MDSEELKLSKWAIRIRPTLTMPWEEFPAQKFVAAQLLSMVESQGVQRFVLRSDAEEAGHTLLIILEEESSKVDELQLPSDATASLRAALDASTRLLPIAARRFQDWTVGFLER
ncbi:MAG: hypothetical protein LQ346_002230 [Caloplaca aetnensis]|nr:MAG: hypothetical protein LQ346_002230 [Caloplaca aetnensis]